MRSTCDPYVGCVRLLGCRHRDGGTNARDRWPARDPSTGRKTARLELTRNPDILASVARSKGERLVVGFALETGDGERRAQAKLRRKNLDYVVLNDESALNATRSSATILGADGSRQGLARRSKEDIAEVLAELVIAKAR
ncbi:MAG TPA: phosphopantothenoylcysteine decarboxylase [Planctomycetota bacterium]|nr:phosphopantothenoylcysteine decarboxylase [Planctomycetota bacterium]